MLCYNVLDDKYLKRIYYAVMSIVQKEDKQIQAHLSLSLLLHSLWMNFIASWCWRWLCFGEFQTSLKSPYLLQLLSTLNQITIKSSWNFVYISILKNFPKHYRWIWSFWCVESVKQRKNSRFFFCVQDRVNEPQQRWPMLACYIIKTCYQINQLHRKLTIAKSFFRSFFFLTDLS